MTNLILLHVLMWLQIASITESDPRIDVFGNSSNVVEYQYRYSVDESLSRGPVMDRWEHRIGEYVKGAYSVLEPDGRIRTVDYEVDGGKGYHAVIRMNEPGPRLLSYQQLTKSAELFPAAALPSHAAPAQTRNARNDGKIWNYHSKSPYLNGAKTEQRDHRGSATSQVHRAIPAAKNSDNLPPSPVNFNVPQTKNLIHFVKPAGFILGKSGAGAESKTVKRSPRDEDSDRLRNSKLVKRIKSVAG